MQHDFRYISKNDPDVKQAYRELCEMIRQVQDVVRDDFTFQTRPVGSYSRNMITYDAKSNIGYDFDINIEVNDDEGNYSAQEIKDILRNAFNGVVRQYGYSYPEDSTRVLTIKKIDHYHSRILHSCDFAIVYNGTQNGESVQQYIHYNKSTGEYTWNEQSKGYYRLDEKVEWLKGKGLWLDLRDYYIEKKNRNTDPDVHSRTLFAIAVNEMCQKNGYFE